MMQRVKREWSSQKRPGTGSLGSITPQLNCMLGTEEKYGVIMMRRYHASSLFYFSLTLGESEVSLFVEWTLLQCTEGLSLFKYTVKLEHVYTSIQCVCKSWRGKSLLCFIILSLLKLWKKNQLWFQFSSPPPSKKPTWPLLQICSRWI